MLVIGGDVDHVAFLWEINAIVSICTRLFEEEEGKSLLSVLNGSSSIFEAAKKKKNLQNVLLCVSQCDGLEQLKKFEGHVSKEVSIKSKDIQNRYFSTNKVKAFFSSLQLLLLVYITFI